MLGEAVPPARKDDVVDDYHGTLVPDPYRWLEDAGAPDTLAWVEAQNAVTARYLGAVPVRDALRRRLTELWDYPRYSVPQRRGDHYFFSRNDGLQDQAVLYVQDGAQGQPRVVIDPNTFASDGTVALTQQAPSEDGALLVYGVSVHGSDRQELKVRDVATGRDYDETIRWCKFASVAWKHDNSGFYYDRFPEPGSVAPEDENNFSRVYWHQVGTPQARDTLVYERPEAKELGFSPSITDDGRYLVLTVYHGTSTRNRLYYRPVDGDGPFVRLLDEADAGYTLIDAVGSVFYIHTDLDAPRGRIVAVDVRHPAREHWRDILPQQEDVIHFARMIDERLVVVFMRDAHHVVTLYDREGAFLREVPLPALGSIAGLSGRRRDREMFLAFTSFLSPTTILRYDVATAELGVLHGPRLAFAAADYETTQVFCASRDGTRVPLFLTYKKGLVLDGRAPTVLYGYGGFQISETPEFSPSRLVWLERGGVYATANLRGGGEYGEAWHEAGMLDRKQNVFDDFIAAAEWLIAHGYTSSSRLAIEGGSNGGLLVAACMVQRPDLFGAVVCAVPVIDMLRYHRFTIGRYWTSEYGNAEEDAAQFRYLYAYSPLHNVRPGTRYPPTLIASADTDDRVVPAHAKKFAATLQAAQAGDAPILLRVETKAGHGAGKPTAKVIDERSDIYAFLVAALGVEA